MRPYYSPIVMRSYYSPVQERYLTPVEEIARVGACLPCDALGALQALVGRDTPLSLQCDCPKALLLLMRLGAIHSAKMHAAGADAHPSDWSYQTDWPMHFSEEKRLFFPLLPQTVSDQLLADHDLFLHEIATYGRIVSLELLKSHATMEDLWAGRLLDDLDGGKKSLMANVGALVGQVNSSMSKNTIAGIAVGLIGLGFIASAFLDKRAA